MQAHEPRTKKKTLKLSIILVVLTGILAIVYYKSSHNWVVFHPQQIP